MLGRRVAKLVRRQYTKEPVLWSDLMPAAVNKVQVDDFLIERTMYRPRDLIVFFNHCIDLAAGRPDISATMILAAEGEYSELRLESLGFEWGIEHPELLTCIKLLKKRQGRFRIDSITVGEIEEKCLEIGAETVSERQGQVYHWALEVCNSKLSPGEFRFRLVGVLYKVGVLGVKLESYTSDHWSFQHAPTISHAQLRDDTTVVVCPVFHRALGITAVTK